MNAKTHSSGWPSLPVKAFLRSVACRFLKMSTVRGDSDENGADTTMFRGDGRDFQTLGFPVGLVHGKPSVLIVAKPCS